MTGVPSVFRVLANRWGDMVTRPVISFVKEEKISVEELKELIDEIEQNSK